MLKLEFPNQNKNPVWLVAPTVRLGRSKNNDIVFDEESVSFHHALLTVEGDHVYLSDVAKNQSTYLNGELICAKVELHSQDRIKLSDIEIKVTESSEELSNSEPNLGLSAKSNQWSLVAEKGLLLGRSFEFRDQLLIGRDSNCDIVIDSKNISRKHCKIQPQGGVVFIKDFGSANGTFINDKKITEAYARAGDRIRVHNEEFSIRSPYLDADKTVIVSADSASNPSPMGAKKDINGCGHKIAEPKNDNTVVRQTKIEEARQALENNKAGENIKGTSWAFRVTLVIVLFIISLAIFSIL